MFSPAIGLPPLPPGVDTSLVDVARVRAVVRDSFIASRFFADRDDEDCSRCIVKKCNFVISAPSPNSHALSSAINNVWVTTLSSLTLALQYALEKSPL